MKWSRVIEDRACEGSASVDRSVTGEREGVNVSTRASCSKATSIRNYVSKYHRDLTNMTQQSKTKMIEIFNFITSPLTSHLLLY